MAGDKVGIIYKDGTNGFGMMGPRRLGDVINGLGIKRRLVMISACYSGIFIPPLSGEESIIITAASPVRTSFGCSPGNDWTFFRRCAGQQRAAHAAIAASRNAKQQPS